MSNKNNITEKLKKKSNLILRTISALIALCLLYFAVRIEIFYPHGWSLLVIIATVSILALREFLRLMKKNNLQPFELMSYVMTILLLVATVIDDNGFLKNNSYFVNFKLTELLLAVAVVGILLLQLTRKTNEGAFANVGVTFLAILYCWFLPAFFLRMRWLSFELNDYVYEGIEFVVACIFLAKISDIGALLVGSSWGKHKMIPRLSPGKTWEGAIGGLLFNISLLGFMVWTAPGMSLAKLGIAKLVLLSVVIFWSSLAGDLIESCFKRDSKIKDAGKGVPGFGGILDIIDSLMLAAPIMYYFLLLNGAKPMVIR